MTMHDWHVRCWMILSDGVWICRVYELAGHVMV